MGWPFLFSEMVTHIAPEIRVQQMRSGFHQVMNVYGSACGTCQSFN